MTFPDTCTLPAITPITGVTAVDIGCRSIVLLEYIYPRRPAWKRHSAGEDQRAKYLPASREKTNYIKIPPQSLTKASGLSGAPNLMVRYQLAVTRRKEEEPQSSSIYNQNDPWTPTVVFANFIDNELLSGEDLVAWVTASFLHIPHAEDVPNTVTSGNGVGFFLRPYNFFDEDPSAFSPDAIYFRDDQNAGICDINPIACLPDLAACVPDLPPFSYYGF